MTTYTQAVDESYGMFTAAWEASAAGILLACGAKVVGYTPEIRYARVEEEDNLPRDRFWARLSHTTIYETHGAIGNRMFEGNILFTMQIFCPRTDRTAFDTGRLLAVTARNAVRGKNTPSGDGYFREARINELPNEDNWICFSASAECYYCEYVGG